MMATAAELSVSCALAMRALLALVAGLVCAGAAWAEPVDAGAWLRKVVEAARQTTYAGVFVYQHGRQVETSRIAHWVDATGEHEVLETLDGPPLEVVRNNDSVTRYLPDSRQVVMAKRHGRQFPALLPENVAGITENYAITRGENDRVAGIDCQTLVLEPKDNLRYGHRFCVEPNSGLLVRARAYDENNRMVESFAFTQLALGSAVGRDLLKSKYAAKSQDWKVDRSALENADTTRDSGWVLKNQPPGFRKIVEMRRSFANRPAAVSHLVYSDGLAAISVFIEPLPKPVPPLGAVGYQGALNIYVSAQAEQMLTVVGETPARTVRQVAESLSPR